jgi:hypothetical protein
MARWRIDRERPAKPQPGRDTEVAVAVHLKQGRTGPEHQVTVEYVQGAPTVTAWAAVQPYLELEKPPRRLVVARDGGVSVVEN